jgi:large subunit ribosomal protein L18
MKTEARAIRHRRIRAHLTGVAERPRLVVFRGSRSLSAQLVDDRAGKVLLTVTGKGAGVEAAQQVGTAIAKKAKTKKVTAAVFDRAGYAYHGAVKTLADAARQEGLKL